MNSKSTAKLTTPYWNEVDEEPLEPRPRDVEEIVELRRRKKTLVDCELPEGFRLVTPLPKQYWMENQLVWGFCLEYVDVVVRGNTAMEHVTYTHVGRYFQTVADDIQMKWVLADFCRELEVAGVAYGDVKRHLPMPLVPKGFKAMLGEKTHWGERLRVAS